MMQSFRSLRGKLAGLVLLLVCLTTGTVAVSVFYLGDRAFQKFNTSHSRLDSEALHAEWKMASVTAARLLARNLARPMGLLDVHAMNTHARLAVGQPGIEYVLVFDGEGRVIAEGSDSLGSSGRKLSDPATKDAFAAREIAVQRSDKNLDVAVPITLFGDRLGTLRVGFSPRRIHQVTTELTSQLQDEIDRAGSELLRIVIAVLAMVGGVALLAGLKYANSLAAPLAELVRVSRSLGAGDLSQRAKTAPTNDEIGELGAAFNEMMARIENHAEGLEREVARKTRQLSESELRLRSIMDHANAEIILTDLNGRYLLVNQAFENNHGLTLKDVIGKSLGEIYPGGETAEFDELDRRVIETGQPVQREIRSMSNPETGHVLTIKFPISDSAGELVSVASINTDISDMKKAQDALRTAHYELELRVDQRTNELVESEERYRRLVDLSPDGIMVHTEGVVVYANQTMAKMLGAESAGELTGVEAMEFVPEEDRAAVLARREQATRETTLPTRETTYCRRDGTFIHVERSIAIITWHGKPSFLILARDITERRQTQQALFQSQKMEAVGQLTGGIAHDFNNLLTVILGHLELLAQHPSQSEALNRMTEMARNAAQRGADLTQRLLAFSRRQELYPRAFDLNRLVGGMEDLLRHSLSEAISMDIRVAPDLWSCKADPGQLESAILNLAINAQDAMPDGGALVIATANVELGEVTADRLGGLAAGRYVTLSITDTGIGMTPELLQRAVEPFFTTKEAGKGTGLGLSMVYGFVRQSGGQVWIASNPGRGTTIKLYLPATREAVRTAETAEADTAAGAPPGSEIVLLVEDDEAVRELSKALLTGLGYSAVEEPDGRAALHRLEQDAPIDLLFTDVVMPGGLNGIELARRARLMRPGLKVLLTSGYAQTGATHKLDPDSEPLLQKPYTQSQLARMIRHTLDAA